MSSLETLTVFLGWCTVLNIGNVGADGHYGNDNARMDDENPCEDVRSQRSGPPTFVFSIFGAVSDGDLRTESRSLRCIEGDRVTRVL